MAFEPKNFDATSIEARAFANDVYGEDFDSEQYKETALIRAILSNQNVRMERTMIEAQRCDGVKVYQLMDDGDIVVRDGNGVNCDIDGNPIGLKGTEYINNIDLEASVRVYDDQCPNEYTATRKFAFARMRIINKIQSEFAKKIAPKLVMNADVNQHESDFAAYAGENDGNVLMLDPAFQEDSKVVSKMYKNAKKHHMGNNLTFISGDNFYETDMNVEYQANGCCNVDKIFKSSVFKFSFDLDNVDQPLTDAGLDPSDLGMIIVIRDGALFFFSNNEYQNTERANPRGDRYQWKEEMPDITYNNGGETEKVYLDWSSDRGCENGRDYTVYNAKLNGGLHTGQEMNNGFKGILAFSGQ
jgi:hypothetical protein